MLRIKLIKSPIGHNWRNRATIQALGLRKINQVVEHDDTPSIRGLIHHIHPLLLVEEVEGTPAKRNGNKPPMAARAAASGAPVAKKAPAKPKAEAAPAAKPAAAAKPKAAKAAEAKPAAAKKAAKPAAKKDKE
jgi:large subunit ribosomal protein L30